MRASIVVPLLLLVALLGCQANPAQAIAIDSDDTSFLTDHSSEYLDIVREHFGHSLDYLFTSNAYGGKSVERPGIAKLLREQSDRHWKLGIDAIKKFFQRGGKATGGNGDFKTKFSFGGTNQLESVGSTSEALLNKVQREKVFSDKYLLQIGKLVTESKSIVRKMNSLHHSASDGVASTVTPYDAEMAHFLEEKMEDEVDVMRKFRNLYTNLNDMKSMGLALHLFDQSI